MTVNLELWHLITLLLAFFSAVWGFGSVILRQIEKRLDERFATLQKSADEVLRIERELMQFKAEMPKMFVMRDDYIRQQEDLNAKLDKLLERLQERR